MKMPKKQTGLSLIFFALILVIASISALFAYMDSGAVKNAREQKTANALAEAKAGLVGFFVKSSDISSLSRMPNPDIRLSPVIPEGSESAPAGVTNNSVIGKFPWRSLDMPPLKDGYGECLWYAVSGHFKKNPPSSVLLNWDTRGQIDVIDENGSVLFENLAAIILSAGVPLSEQDRSNGDADLVQCGGNYDVKNYLDTYDEANAILGEVNYFPDSFNNRQAADALNKRFVFAQNGNYNDRIVTISVDDLFKPIIRRKNFKIAIDALMNNSEFLEHLAEIGLSGGKGTDEIDCDKAPKPAFCNNWKEMLFLTELSPISKIEIDGELTSTECSRVFIFSGQKTLGQSRSTEAEKNNPANYLEDENLANFSLPVANGEDFKGVSEFNSLNPSADIIGCIE